MTKYIIWDFDGTLAQRPGRWSGALYELTQQHCPELAIDITALRDQSQRGFP